MTLIWGHTRCGASPHSRAKAAIWRCVSDIVSHL
jgi:ribosomal protein L37AE/L43A